MLAQVAGHTGLFERLVAVTGAAALAMLAIGVIRRTRDVS